MSEGADQVYEVYEPPCLSCCVGTEAIGSCMSGQDREPQRVMGLAARNKERGQRIQIPLHCALVKLLRASGSAVVRRWFEAIACFLMKLLQS